MSLQRSLNCSLVFAVCGTLLQARIIDTAVHPIRLLFTFSVLLFTAVSCTGVYIILIYPYYLSPLRHLPTAPQKPLRKRIFKEPNAFHFERWINEMPNAEIIRYFGFLNGERLFMTTPAGLNQVLRQQASKMEKQYASKTLLQRYSGSKSLVISEHEVHKNRRRFMEPAFRKGQIKQAYHPIFWAKSAEMLDVIQAEKASDSNAPRDEETNDRQVCNMDDIIGRTIFDIVGLTSMNMDWGALSSPEKTSRTLSPYRAAFVPSQYMRNNILLAFVAPKWLADRLTKSAAFAETRSRPSAARR